MTSTVGTFSSVHLRERDKILAEKHAKSQAILERKVERLKRSNDDTLKQLFEAQTRGNRLAESLGFHDVYEAQVAIDTADREIPYKQCLERIESLERELSQRVEQNDKLRDNVRSLEQETEKVKVALASTERSCGEAKSDASESRATADKVSQELGALQVRYDELLDVKERAAQRYKVDFAKWRNLSRWLFKDITDVNEQGISEEELKRREFVSVLRKKKILAKFGLESIASGGPPTPKALLCRTTNVCCDQDDQSTPILETKKRRLETPASTSSTVVGSPKPAFTSTDTPSLRKSLFKLPVRDSPPSSSPTIFQDSSMPKSTRQPLIFHSIAQRSPRTRLSTSTRNSMYAVNGASSDTEDDSQAVGQFPAPLGPFKVPTSPATSPAPMASSQTEFDSQSQIWPPRVVRSSAKPMGPPPQTNVFRQVDIVARDADTLRPTKVRRLSGEAATSSTSTRKPPKPPAVDLEKGCSLKVKREGDKENSPARVVAGSGSAAKRLGDYSAFKGRGRYAKDVTSPKDTINAQYVIDPSRNGGLDFQYGEVVRAKEDRRHMEAGDCECCREYYEAVGPLPERLRPPLWRSPSTTPTKRCAGARRNTGSADRRQAEMDSHRKAISRHRHHWARAKTPPGYWSIGFPDTQEAANINQQAKEMHEKKMAEVDAAAKAGGRYKKRGG